MAEISEEHVKSEKDPDSGRNARTEYPSPWDGFPTILPFDWEGNIEPTNVWTRLGFLIPAAPWPVLLWFVAQGPQPYGFHGAEPLHLVASEASVLIIACTVAGAVCHLAGHRSVRSLRFALLLLTIHLCLIYTFFERYSYAYG